MSNVYLAFRNFPHETPYVIGVFTSREKAQEYLTLQEKQDAEEDPDITWEYSIELATLDPSWS